MSEAWRFLLEESGALRHGHVLLSSGLHSPAYVQCALLLEEPERARRVGSALAVKLGALQPDAVVSPALGGLIVGFATASSLGLPFRFTERDKEGRMELRRGFSVRPGERLAVVEDVVTTGKSTRETIAVLEGLGAEVLAVGAILDRTGSDVEAGREAGADAAGARASEATTAGGDGPEGRGDTELFDVPFETLLSLELPTYPPDSCPLCADGSVPEKPGSRKDP